MRPAIGEFCHGQQMLFPRMSDALLSMIARKCFFLRLPLFYAYSIAWNESFKLSDVDTCARFGFLRLFISDWTIRSNAWSKKSSLRVSLQHNEGKIEAHVPLVSFVSLRDWDCVFLPVG